MNHADARRRYNALMALADPSRGGTPAECATAKAKAEALHEKYLQGAPLGESAEGPGPFWAERAPGPYADTVTADDLMAAMNAAFGYAWDWRAARHSANVVVHYHDGPGNWRIEIF